MGGLALGCVADDYTGASDLANTLTRCGLRTIQTIGIPDPSLDLPDVDAIVVALKSRSVTADEAVAKSMGAEAFLRARGASHVMFKVCSTFDSTDKGNIGPVMDALQAASGDRIVIVTPAFPGTARTVYQGHLFVGSLPLNESPLKDHPLNPMTDSNLVRVLARQSKQRIGLLALSAISGGPYAIAVRLSELHSEGMGAAIADAVHDSDLETLGLAALEHRFSVGASGLGLGLARGLVSKGAMKPRPGQHSSKAEVAGHAACLAGSCSQATLRQIEAAGGSMPVWKLSGESLMSGSGPTESAIEWALGRIKDGPVLIASSDTPQEVAALQARYGRDEAGHRIERAMADIAEALVGAGVRRLVIAGGETSGAVVDRLGIEAFLLREEIAPGVPMLETRGGRHKPMLMALKSGNFGGDSFFMDALRLMAD